MTNPAIKTIHAKLRDKTGRYGFDQRALLLYLAFLKARLITDLERSIHETTFYSHYPLDHHVARHLDREGIVAKADFPAEAFRAWVGDAKGRIKEHQPPKERPAMPATPAADEKAHAAE